ncbi:A-kinase anchor protein 10, mitochondrial-like [Lingula anatina]|uniref:A-kinase anchor protein 10, mitochondrial-like n=1 Tax=Lingula anatina TaxID=7574 RepID=A0A2R2MIJ6_LINAN|nr:A-kinase anchor protein 10, mitochondrial-like [Lingula anatina]|eukprot:XP_023930046.1 A-kinase anchor protein 10, mitochondrial-like [Lingula anatina]
MPLFGRKSTKSKGEKATTAKMPNKPSPVQGAKEITGTASKAYQLQRSPTSPNGDIGIPDNPLKEPSGSVPKPMLLRSASHIDNTGGDLGFSSQNTDPIVTSSRLSKTIHEVLHDKDALAYFIQFMDSKHAVHLIKFWLDAESFQASSYSRIRTHSLQTLRKNSTLERSKQPPAGSGEHVQSEDDSNKKPQHKEQDTDCANSERQKSDTDNAKSGNDVQTVSDTVTGHNSNSDENKDCKDAKDRLGHGAQGEHIQQKPSPGRITSKDNLGDKLRKSIEKDAVCIYSKYLSHDAPHPVPITEELRNEAISKICREDGHVDPLCFIQCQEVILGIMETEYFPEFLRSEFHCKHQIDVLTSGDVYLADILYNDTAMFYFMEYMEQEGAMDLLQLYLALDNFQQHLASQHGQYDGQEAQADAMVLYDKYFSLQATCQVGFDDKVRFEVESNICREGGPLPDCFAWPKGIVFLSLEKNYFPQFHKSELYYKYLSELISTIQANHEQVPQTRKKRTGSDASSDTHSIGSHSTGGDVNTKNTLLATGSQQQKAFNKFTDDIQIDFNTLNPDVPLWTRTNANSFNSTMSLGKVDEFGQFVSEFEPEPDHDKKKESRWRKKRKEKDKAQEDMAWQIAQMIVRDVTDQNKESTPENQKSGNIN